MAQAPPPSEEPTEEELTRGDAGPLGDELDETHDSGTGAEASASPATVSGRGQEGMRVSLGQESGVRTTAHTIHPLEPPLLGTGKGTQPSTPGFTEAGLAPFQPQEGVPSLHCCFSSNLPHSGCARMLTFL